ncbi:hypothetical protein [Nitrososphaera sp.]|uniref:hypothetical protein n=1 Tax=Nitrososphaera sp. TaxID=1971748 RepID=UPI00307D08D7
MNSDFEARLQDLEKRVALLEQQRQAGGSGTGGRTSSSSSAADADQLIAKNVDGIGTQDLILVALWTKKPQMTKAEIRAVLQDWGKAFGSWFEGGNFSGRLVRAGLVKKDGEREGEDLFALTKKGEVSAQEILDNLKKDR